MSLAAAVEAARIQAPAKTIATLDIERVPGKARVQHRGLTIEGDFWDLSGWKHTIGRRIDPDDVIEWPRTICAAWRWYGNERVEFAAEWQKGGRDKFLEKTWNVYDRADIIVGHHVAGFDTKHLAGEWNLLGLSAPSPWKTVDTLKEARKRFGYESMKLDSLCERLGIPAKTDRYQVAVARAACAGDRQAQKKLADYNRGDIVASEALYDRLRPWMSSHPHSRVGTADDRVTCPNCWGDRLERNGTKLAAQITYVLYRCLDCGANVQGTRHSRAAITRGAA